MRCPNDRRDNPKAPAPPAADARRHHPGERFRFDPSEDRLEEHHHRRLHARLGHEDDSADGHQLKQS
jgi:hypothetical protein